MKLDLGYLVNPYAVLIGPLRWQLETNNRNFFTLSLVKESGNRRWLNDALKRILGGAL